MKIGPGQAFLLSFAVGFVIGFAFIGLSFGWLTFLIPAQALFFAQLFVGLMFGILLGFLGLGIFYVWSVLGRRGQLLAIVAIFAIGIITVQPEIDGLALIALAFTALGVGKGRGR